ncbi:NAD(P)-linked oxidoreductase superfamily protein [Prunus dulcis]|uniref:NAD(P)-linked oxidoreductase superfamily protein n=1 Tax=Prunus dulcis TaxID=3755 RepID=A0A4Y1REK4_PRUDU|nr:NAD(P)-linked oxidoreductase superfamily protein [Prunus dulcis]
MDGRWSPPLLERWYTMWYEQCGKPSIFQSVIGLYVFTCGGRPISWRVVLQSVTALSTTKEEYMRLTEASKEALWLTRLAKEFGITQDLVVIQSNSQSVKCLVKN